MRTRQVAKVAGLESGIKNTIELIVTTWGSIYESFYTFPLHGHPSVRPIHS